MTAQTQPTHSADGKLLWQKVAKIIYGDDHDNSEKVVEGVVALVQTERSNAALEAQTNAVAWTIGVVDDLHMQTDEYQRDRTYKGVKNTLRDRYKAEIGIDPAPSYPVKAELKQGPNHAK